MDEEIKDSCYLAMKHGIDNEYEIRPRIAKWMEPFNIKVEKPTDKDLMLIGPKGQEWHTEIKLGREKPKLPKEGDPYIPFKCQRGRGMSIEIDKAMVKWGVGALNLAGHRDNYHSSDRVWVIVRLDFPWTPEDAKEMSFLASIGVYTRADLRNKIYIAKWQELVSTAANPVCHKEYDVWKRACLAWAADPACLTDSEIAALHQERMNRPDGKTKYGYCNGDCGFVPNYPRIGFTWDGKLKSPWYEIK